MILKALTLENFKGIREPVRIELAPLTLLFGANNAGKSTIVQALMYAREVLERNNCDAEKTALGGDIVDLGGFRSLVHAHELSRSIKMRFDFELESAELHDYVEASDQDELYDANELEWARDPRQNPDGLRVSRPSASELTCGLHEWWVELEIARFDRDPTVIRYEVGFSGASLAKIVLNDNGKAGVLATEKSYYFAIDTDDLDTDLVSLYRQAFFLGDPADEREAAERGLELPYPNAWYKANIAGEAPHAPVNWQGRLREYRLLETAPVLHRFMEKLEVSRLCGYFERKWLVENPLPLQQKGTALPDWKRKLPLHERLWDMEWEKESCFADTNAFQDYLAGNLTSLIVGPGRCLLKTLQDCVFLSVFREVPSRLTRTVERRSAPSLASGRAAWDALLADDERLVAETNRWLAEKSRLDSGYEICVAKHRELPEDSELWRALVKDDAPTNLDAAWLKERLDALAERRRLELVERRTGVRLVPQDLGVGISQVIPVIVAALHHPSGVVAIEEPESNIHPAFQVVLADLFITQAKVNPGVMFLIETHSEHLMLRCLRRIRETSEGEVPEGEPSLKPEDIAVHFVEPGDDGPRIHRIRIDEHGEFLDPWPRGFFRERSKELYGDDL